MFKELKTSAEDLHAYLFYGALDPKTLESCFLSLAILMYMSDTQILSDPYQRKIAHEIDHLKDKLDGGSLRVTDVCDELISIIQHINDDNLKARIVTLLVELEHTLCISPKGKFFIESSDFQTKVAPFFRLLTRNLTSIEATIIYKELDEIKRFMHKNPTSIHETLHILHIRGDKLEKKVI